MSEYPEVYEGPGSRRFRDLLARERHDMGWLVHNVAAMYDEISGGRISKPNTYPSEVIGAFNERADEWAEEARDEVRDEFATFLLDAGYGTDFAYGELRPSVEVLEAMVRLAAGRPDFVGADDPQDEDDTPESRAYFVLSAEIGDWRAES